MNFDVDRLRDELAACTNGMSIRNAADIFPVPVPRSTLADCVSGRFEVYT